MKKFFSLALIALTAMTMFSSCDKEGKKDDEKAFKQTARMATMSAVYGQEKETWTYTYGNDGLVTKIVADWEGSPYSEFVFTYSGSNCSVKDALDNNALKFDIELNADKLAKKITEYGKETTVYEITYTKDGFLSEVKINGSKATNQEITGEECVDYWTRKGDNDTWRQKQHTYVEGKENCGAVHTEWAEDSGLKRWFYESGLVGRASRFVCATAQWADRTALAEYQYDYDQATGAISKEVKNYGEPGKLEFDCEYQFTWTAIK